MAATGLVRTVTDVQPEQQARQQQFQHNKCRDDYGNVAIAEAKLCAQYE